MSEENKFYGDNVYVMEHPFIQHKITTLRDKSTITAVFRRTVEEISMMMCYEALRDLPLEMVDVETPWKSVNHPRYVGKKLPLYRYCGPALVWPTVS